MDARIFLPHFLSTLGESKCSSPARFLYYLFNGILKVCQCYYSDIVKDLVCTSGVPDAFILYWTFCFFSYLCVCVFSPDDIKDVAFCRPLMDPQQSALDLQQQARPERDPLGTIKKR